MSAIDDLKELVKNKTLNELTAIEFLLLFFVEDYAEPYPELLDCRETAAKEYLEFLGKKSNGLV